VARTTRRPAYFSSFARSKRYLSMARLMSSATGAPVLSDRTTSFLSWSSFRKSAVRFMTIRYHIGIQMAIGRKYWTEERDGTSFDGMAKRQTLLFETCPDFVCRGTGQ